MCYLFALFSKQLNLGPVTILLVYRAGKLLTGISKRGGLNWSEKGENEPKKKLETDVRHQGGYYTTGKYKGHVLRTLSTARMLTPD